MNLYLAAPFFSPHQLEVVQALERIVRDANMALFSPRLVGGILKDMSPADRQVALSGVFRSNVDGIDACNLMLAWIDGRDTGVVWEIGYAYAKKKKIFTFTLENFGLNVMIQKCVSGHARSFFDVAEMFTDLHSPVDPKFLNFNPNVT